jgi:hypothetical protein
MAGELTHHAFVTVESTDARFFWVVSCRVVSWLETKSVVYDDLAVAHLDAEGFAVQ